MITFIVCSHDEDTDLQGVLKDPRLLEICHKANYKIRVIPKPSNSFFRRNLVEPILKNGYITEEDFSKIFIYEKDGLHIDYRFVNEIREELKGIELGNNGQS